MELNITLRRAGAFLLMATAPLLLNAQQKTNEVKITTFKNGVVETKVITETRNNCSTTKISTWSNHHDNYNYETKTVQRPLLGIYPNESESSDGVVVESAIRGKGAAAAGIQGGDVILSVDGKNTQGPNSIARALEGHKEGDVVPVRYRRGNQVLETEVKLHASSHTIVQRIPRDPCKPFIGVYTNNTRDGQGVRITGIIDNTPAKEVNLQADDIIRAFDGVSISNYNDLYRERDKHKAGDKFRLSIEREGKLMEVKARFPACDQGSTTPQPEESAPTTENRMDAGDLVLEQFQLFPNPAVELVNVQFRAEAAPITVSISDVSGKLIYNRTINNFNGVFNEQIDLRGNAPGIYGLRIQQGDKVSTKKISIISRL